MRAKALVFAGVLFAAVCSLVEAGTGVAGTAPAQIRPAPIDPDASYPEGPLYWRGALYVAEMGADRVSRYLDGRKSTLFSQPGCGPTAVAPYGSGLAVLCHLAGAVVAINGEGVEVARFRVSNTGQRLRDPNDASADGRGGVYFSDPGIFSRDVPAQGAVYHLSAAGVLRRVAADLWYSNGVYVDQAAGALLVSEHLAGKVWRYPILADSGLGPRELVFDAAPFLGKTGYREAGPDGLEIGPDRRLYVALYGEGVIVSAPLIKGAAPAFATPTPMQYVTNIAFGARGQAVIVGPYNNLDPPFPGAVVRWPLEPFRPSGPGR